MSTPAISGFPEDFDITLIFLVMVQMRLGSFVSSSYLCMLQSSSFRSS